VFYQASFRKLLAMPYLLLTGATGFLGRYLLRDLLADGVSVAVLVRPGRLESGGQRIEAVMRHWESQAGHHLPRPVVFAGDLSAQDLGLSHRDRKWIGEHCDTLLHCAAAMTFRADARGEPWRTNVEGTRHVLDLCRQVGILKLHHVSTAYVCGLRVGRIRESELDVGQKYGNVYEESKIQAETLLRTSGHFHDLTVYRPSSIVGDSRSGYATSYHGFYLPLHLAYTVAGKIPYQQMGERFFSLLGFQGNEGKNLVPVDWLSAAITYLVRRPEHHGKTYHLASPRPVTVRLIQEIVQEAIQSYTDRQPLRALSDVELASYERLFHDYMGIYRSHFRDDPEFDLTNTAGALAELPCPPVDRQMLLRVARFAMDNKFGAPRWEPIQLDFDAAKHLDALLQVGRATSGANGATQAVALQVNGSGGGQWHVWVDDGKVIGAGLGLGGDPCARIYLNTTTFASLASHTLSVEQSLARGRVLLERVRRTAPDLVTVLKQLVSISN
jgi:thioester reductase-like protein